MPVNQTSSTSDIELRSEEVQEILSKIPHWMIRWGTGIIFVVIIMIFAGSWFFKYPDLIKSEIILTTQIPPEKLIPKTSGRIQELLVKNNQNVTANTPLAIIENAANYLDIFKLKNDLKEYQKNNISKFNFEKFKNAQLGEIEAAYANFKRDYIANQFNKQYKPYQVEEMAQTNENGQIKERLTLLNEQQKINEQELKLQNNELVRYTKLHEKGVISLQEFETKKMLYLQAEKNYKNLLTAISQLKSLLIQNNKSLKGNLINEVKEKVNLNRNLSESFYQLQKTLKDWELSYVLQSRIDGKVSFSKIWIRNQTVIAGEDIFSIVPTQSNSFLGKVKAPAINSGKIKIGQKVNIRLFNFPDNEFGVLKGKIQNISLVPDKDGNILIDVILSNGLKTSYKKTIPFQQEMRGTAEIITEDLRLIERIFYQFKDMTRV